jgi:hypothetical protein
MPALVIDGEYTDGRTKDCAARPCEWCGIILTEKENHIVFASWLGERPTGVERIAVMIRMCYDCFDIYSELGRAGIKEI